MADAGVKMVAPAPASPAASGPKFKRHLRNYLLDKSLQLRYVLFVSILSSVLTSGLGYFVWYQANYATRKIGESMRDFGDPALTEWVMSNLQKDDQGLVLMMALAGLALIAVLSLYLIVMTHKVAGPLYKMGLYFDKIRDGRLPKIEDLRRGDQLRDVFHHFQDMVDAVRARAQREVDTYDKFLVACEAAGVSSAGELGHRLDELRALKKSRESVIE